MDTEPTIVPPANFTDEDIAKWMKEKVQSMGVLERLHVERKKLAGELEKLDAEIEEWTLKSALQIQSE